jgi:uncharacterized pyridoxal phosphate-containing UPF0001 family protein
MDMKTSGDYSRDFNILSMGMSGDYRVAIECGANIIRVGTGLFGPPVEPDDGDEHV